MGSNEAEKAGESPLLYYRTKDEIKTYAAKSVEQKLKWLQAQMEFFHKAMPAQRYRPQSPGQPGPFFLSD